MVCPSCKQALIVLELDQVEIDYCLSCGGIWLDAGELGLILHGRPDANEPPLFGAGTHGSRRCPMCREKMNVAKLPKSGVEIDFCGRRHGLWLDKGELQQVIDTEADDARVSKLRDFCAKLFPAK
jgi:Zn-finger nucleic acid-binding protein